MTEQWKKRFDKELTDKAENRSEVVFAIKAKKFIKNLLRQERKRDKLQEILDYIEKSKSGSSILISYIKNNTSSCIGCELPSIELANELGIELYSETSFVLGILEKYFKEHPLK